MIRVGVACALLAAVLACTPMPSGDAPTHDCTSIIDCELACPASQASCFSSCVSNGSTRGKSEYASALGCAQQVCAGMTGLAARCQLNTTTNTFVDVPGGPSGDCAACLADAGARLFQFTCAMPSSPYCNPSQCASATDTCRND